MPPSNAKESQRIAKLLARAGIASRREIERMIADGRIALNGVVLDTPATLLTSLEGVTVDGNPVEAPEPARLFRYHKPAGLLTAERDFTGRPTIYDRLPPGLPRVIPVGRLDLGTEGLLLLTTDGELKRELELPSTGVERSYRARAYGHVTQAQLEELMLGVEIEGVRYGSINANIERRTGANLWIEMTLTEGKNREVRRVLEHLGLQVSRLIRTRYGPFYLGDLPIGDVDEIRASDLNTFRTVLSKPGGGKAASNLQFAVRARVVASPAPRPEPVRPGPRREPERSATRAAGAARHSTPRPEAPGGEARFPTRVAPNHSDAPREEVPRRGPLVGKPFGSSGENRFPKRTVVPRQERLARAEAPARRGAGCNAPAEASDAPRPDRKEARFTPRVTPGRADPGRPARSEAIEKPARAARARAHRDTQEPRSGEIGDGPRKLPRTRGPSDGRGKPAKPKRPTRSRK
ncbi:pseudouridine synthase [Sphingomonas sp. M1-B02]|uniref:pseudouridine synthase n=1 Tax=Sphingomonas sp. M1-B02 TaxID=3114300 RepID=UPI00223EA625|nr:pseudouridine synthase [Sphingomonas sp. S6-11]UZK66894.1 pseudouridine synthase [Sphingomonas sp. S6-11]